uniref:IENR2 domain-containing protein n=1 Tax=Panagrellus redivivus TaxID=6233 RepID=A0A7E4URE2_PANRE
MQNIASIPTDNQENHTPGPSTSSEKDLNPTNEASFRQQRPLIEEDYVDIETIDSYVEILTVGPESSDNAAETGHLRVDLPQEAPQPSTSVPSGSATASTVDPELDDGAEPVPINVLHANFPSEASSSNILTVNAELQSRANRVLTSRNSQLKARVEEQQQIISDQKKKIFELRKKLRETMNGRPRKPINKALSKTTKRVHLKKFYDINGITPREAFNIMPNKLSVEEDAAIMTAIGMSQNKRRKLKMLLIKHGCDILAANNNVENLLSAQKTLEDGSDNEETSNEVVADTCFESESGMEEEDDRDSEMFDDFVDAEPDEYPTDAS